MRLRAKHGSKRQDGSPRKQEKGNVGPEAGRRRRLTRGSLGPPGGGPVGRDCRVPTAGSRAFIQDAGRGRASIPHGRPGYAAPAVREARPAESRLAPRWRLRWRMDTPYYVGIDVALHDHRVAIWGPDGEARGKSVSIPASQ